MAVHYLYGDPEGVRDEAEQILAESPQPRHRLDASEPGMAEDIFLGASLFGDPRKTVLVRDLTRARPAEIRRWLALATRVPEDSVLILCAPGVAPRKHAWHADLCAISGVQARQVRPLTGAAFADWLAREAEKAGVRLAPDALAFVTERLAGMRQAARAFLERARDYLDQGSELDVGAAARLLGERAPTQLSAWLRQACRRSPEAIPLALRLLDEGMSPLLLLAALGERLLQLFLLHWHRARRTPQPHAKARIQAFARAEADEAARRWTAKELARALRAVADAELALKSGRASATEALLDLLTRIVETPSPRRE